MDTTGDERDRPDDATQDAGDAGLESRDLPRAPDGWYRLADLVPDPNPRRSAQRYLERSCSPGVHYRKATRAEGGSQELWVAPGPAGVVVSRYGQATGDTSREGAADAVSESPAPARRKPAAAPDLAALVDRLAESERLRGVAEGRVGELVAARDAATADRDRERARADRLGQELAELRRERDALRLQLGGLREAVLRWHAGLRRWRRVPPLPAELASDAPRVTG